MRWRKLGLIYGPTVKGPKLLSHAANPTAVHLEGDVYRVFYSGRDAVNRSSVSSVDIDVVRREVVAEADGVLFSHGPPGSFYSAGVSIGCTYESGGANWMLFMGWQVPDGGHWRGDIGRLRLDTAGSLRLAGTGPFLASTPEDPVSLSYPWVLRRGSTWHMWYGSTVVWDAGNGEMLHVINHATSEDGEAWVRHGQAIPHEIGVAQAFSRPTVLPERSGLSMWFSYRSGTGQTYRIGHATSDDGDLWRLALERTGIDVSDDGWDSQMVCYPFVFDHRGSRYMFYNGNSYGRTGFGLAVQE
jgi:hypothetical protein